MPATVKFFGRYKGGPVRDGVLIASESDRAAGPPSPDRIRAWSCDTDGSRGRIQRQRRRRSAIICALTLPLSIDSQHLRVVSQLGYRKRSTGSQGMKKNIAGAVAFLSLSLGCASASATPLTFTYSGNVVSY